MKNLVITLSAVCLFFTFSCKSEPEKIENKQKPRHYIVLLDLSDRIISEGQANRDIEIIQAVFREYDDQVRKNLVINSRDKFQIIIAPQKGVNYNSQEFEDVLFIDMAIIDSGPKINALEEFEKNLPVKLTKLYSLAYLGDKTSIYPGAAIWQFFNENLEHLAEDKYENILVVVTDGYFDLEDYGKQLSVDNRFPTSSFLSSVRNKTEWRKIMEDKNMGLIPVNKNFNNLKIIVAEVSPKYDFQYEFDMLTYVWTKWCKEMNNMGVNVLPKTSLPQVISLLRNNLNSNI